MRFSVWAPRAREGVELDLGGARWTLERGAGNFWFRDVPNVVPGTEYAFVVDGGRPLPDPRSRSQPQGVHGPSQVVDLGAFRWTDQSWRGFHLPGSVLYELHVGTFSASGTFDGAIEHLDHLVALGVDAIELMPVVEFPGARGWGYDGVDLFAPHHAYGGPDGLMRLIDACHARGLGVVIDVVYNHLGPSGNYLAQFGPYFSERHHTNWGSAVNLDGVESDQVRRFFLDNARMWLEDYHADGLRLDAVHALVDDSALHLLEELSREVEDLAAALGRPLWLLPESDLSDPRFVLPRTAGGYGLDAAWADEWHHALHAALTGERDGYYADFGTLAHLAKALQQAWVYDGLYSPHRRRRHGRPPVGLSGHQFVVSAQNHDQVGNRAQGERLSHLVSPACQKIAAALLLTSPFVPLLFQGEEWGAKTPFLYFTDHEDEELGRAVSEGRRNEFRAFGWDPTQVPDPQDPETFRRSKLDWGELTREPHDELLAWHERLLRLRREHPELRSGRLDEVRVTFDEAERWLVVFRRTIAVAINLGQHRVRIPLAHGARPSAGPETEPRVLLASSECHPVNLSRDEASLELDPACVAIVSLG